MSQAHNKTSSHIRLRLTTLAVASACATLAPAFAQEAATNTVTVTGIRASMQSTLNLKRNSDGIVDGIVADDIGKFPDTNLAEAVQRISGVSIDRSNGEGQRVTIRGVGPDLNMVLLNGRTMPTSNLDNRGSRAFDFSNLASEAVSQIQVYKSARADQPAGGIGATLNIMTGRPLDLGNQTSVGGKIAYDRSNNNIPGMLKGANLTPEVSVLVSRKFGQDDMFGIGLTANYSKRNSGFANVQTGNGFIGPYAGLADPKGSLDASSRGITNLAPGQLYDTPQNVGYNLGGTQRKRTNAQLTFQFRPTRDWTNTLDYTYSQNRRQVKTQGMGVWFSKSAFVDGAQFVNGPVQTVSMYSEDYTGRPQDTIMGSQDFGTKATLKSIGFNSQFRVNSGLKFSLDAHHSTSESGSDSPYGTSNIISGVSFGRVHNSVDYTQEMPVLNLQHDYQPWQVSGSQFDDAHIKQTVDQIQLGGSLKLGESSTLNFGGNHSKTRFNSEYQHVAANAWGGVVNQKERNQANLYFDQANFHPEDYRRYFSKLGGSGDPKLYPTMQVLDFGKVRDNLIAFTTAGGPHISTAEYAKFTADMFAPSLSDPSEVRALQEKTNSLYTQFNTEWDTAMPIHTGVGVRYEKSTVDTQYSINPAIFANWNAQNEIEITKASTASPQAASASYHYWMPTADFDIDLLSNLKLRASWGVTIGRPNWDQIQGGQSLGSGAGVTGLNGSQGNPGLRPVKSNNLDLSAEWYYTKQSMVSLGLFNKDLSGYAGTTIQTIPSTTLKTPIGSPAYAAAVASCGNASTFCVRNYIFANYNGQPGVTQSGFDASGGRTGSITSDIAGAVPIPLLLSTTVNANKSNIKGAELNWQHMFDNGFGFQANYTYVKSGLRYDVSAPSTVNGAQQFAMVGLANSANVVGIYEDNKTTVRLAYNWRGEFLNSLQAFNQPEPGFTEAYGQVDLSVGYNLSKNLALSFEGINILNATQRIHARTRNEILQAQVTGPRYMLGARYKF